MKYSGAQSLTGGLMSPVGRLQRPQMALFMAPQVRVRAAQVMRQQSPAGRTPLNGLGRLGRLGAFGSTAVNQGVTGVKAGVSAAGVSTAVATSVAGAIGAGAAAGSVVPIIGTAIGAIVGLVASGVFNHRADPEVGNFNQAVAVWQASRMNALNIANKYLVLAGLFDLLPGQIKGNIPIYKKYGRMGEQAFVTDMGKLIYAAAQAGQITASDTPQTVMSRIVQPWIDSWGYGPMTDAHADLISLIILGMVAEYLAGGQNRWTAVGGDYPFASLPKFALPSAAAPAATAPAQSAGQPALSANGSQLTAGSAATLMTPAGVFSYSGGAWRLNGNPVGYTELTAITYKDGQVIATHSNGGTLQWSSSAGWWVPLTAATAAPAQPAQSVAPAGTVLQAGTPGAMGTSFGVVTLTADGSWQLNGTAIAYTPAHQSGGAGTVAMQWTGTQLQALNSDGWTGYWNGSTWITLTAASAVAPGTLTPAAGGTSSAPSLSSNPYPATTYLPTPTYVSTPYTDPSGGGGSAPAPAAGTPAGGIPVVAAGVAGLPSWLTWGAALGVVGLLFATARPAGGSSKSAKRGPRAGRSPRAGGR